MKEITFSIITPCFNSDTYISETIESVLLQSGPFKIQYIIVDGGSTDSTLPIIREYQHNVKEGHYLGRNLGIEIILLSEPDQGMYDALAKGFTYVTGDICSYINSDDFYQFNAFRSALSVFIHHNNVNWITGVPNTYNSFGANIKRTIPFEYRQDYIRKGIYGRQLSHIQQESIFWRSTLLNQINNKKLSSYKYAGDFYLWHEFSKLNKLWIADTILSGFRTHLSNKSLDIESYNKEFESIVSEGISFKEKIGLMKHKRLWNTSFLIKRKRSTSLISLYNLNLQKKYHEFETATKKRFDYSGGNSIVKYYNEKKD